MMERVFHIHAGAHRTGTSSFQMCLHVNRAQLHRAGYDLGYPGRDGISSGRLSLQLPSPRHGFGKQDRFTERVKRNLGDLARGPGAQMILSEENIPGRMLHFFEGKFYPAAEARSEALMAGLGGQVATLLLVVRDYASLYQSAWRKRAEDQLQPPFADHLSNLLAMDRGWPELVELMRARLRPERFLVVEYKSRSTSVDLLWRMVPGQSGLVEPMRQLNVSVTEAALQEIQARLHAGETLDSGTWHAILKHHAADTAPKGLTHLPEAVRRELDQRYADDVQRIKEMPSVQFFG